jgi:hypothetical protein
MSAVALGDSSVSYRPGGRSTRRFAQPSPRASSSYSAGTSTSVKSWVPRPTQADSSPPPALPVMSILPEGWSWRIRRPVEVPRKVEASECSA